MAADKPDKPQRSGASKQRSRRVSGSVAAQTSARNNRSHGGGGRRQVPSGSGRAGHSARLGPASLAPPRRRPRRSEAGPKAGLFAWSAIFLVLIIVIVVVVVSQTSGKPPTNNFYYTPKPVPASVLHEISDVSIASYNGVGSGLAAITAPSVLTGQPALILTRKPGIFGLFGEFCPFCAAERWAVITSLSRFGTFSRLKTMQSSPRDTDPKTQTFEFATAEYSSPYISAKLLEMFGQDKSTGRHPVINTPTKAERALIRRYDPTGTIPFLDLGNEVVFSGASYSPAALKGLSMATIAAGLSHPSNPVTKLILGASNYLSAGICAIDGGKPGSVCSSSGVRASANALRLSV